MICLVTGGSGFVGKNLVGELIKKGHTVCQYSNPFNCPEQYWYSLYELLEKENFDWIFHCAAELLEESIMFKSNVELTELLLKRSKRVNYKAFIYVGSSSEFGRKGRPISEDDPLLPENIYEATKACGAMLCRAYAKEYDKPIMTIRPFSLYGKHEGRHRFIPTIYNNAVSCTPVKIYNGMHDFVYIKDFVRAMMMMAENPRPGDSLNIGTGTMISNNEVVNIFEPIIQNKFPSIGLEIKREYIDEKLRIYDSDYWVCDTSKAVKKYNFKCEYDLKKGLEDCYGK